MVRDTLLSDRARSRGIFRQSAGEQMIEEHSEGVHSWQNRLWLLLCLELWFVEFIDGS